MWLTSRFIVYVWGWEVKCVLAADALVTKGAAGPHLLWINNALINLWNLFLSSPVSPGSSAQCAPLISPLGVICSVNSIIYSRCFGPVPTLYKVFEILWIASALKSGLACCWSFSCDWNNDDKNRLVKKWIVMACIYKLLGRPFWYIQLYSSCWRP